MILIRFLGVGTLPFCFAGPIQLAHCDACSMQISQGAARSPVISCERQELARSTLCVALQLVPALNMHKLYWGYWPSENKMAAYLFLRIGWVSQRIRWYLRFFYVRQYFNGKKIRRILLKLYVFFFTKWIIGANRSFPRFFSDVWPPKFLTAKNWLPVRLNCFCNRLNGFQNNWLTTGIV